MRGNDPTGETDRSAQGRRHLRKSPRVHDPVASTGAMLHSQAWDGADLRIKIGARNNANCWSSSFSKSVASIQRAAGKHAAAQTTNTRCHCAGPLFLHGFNRTTSWSKKLVRCRSAGHKAGVSDGSMNGPKATSALSPLLQTMGWSTARTSKKLRRSRQSFKHAWQ